MGDMLKKPIIFKGFPAICAFLAGLLISLVQPLPLMADQDSWNDYLQKGQQAYGEGNFVSAGKSFREAIKLAEASRDSDNKLAESLGLLTRCLTALGQCDQAEEFAKRALALGRNIYPANDPHVAGSLADLAAVYDCTGKYGRAEVLIREALDIASSGASQNDPQIPPLKQLLARIYLHSGKDDQCEVLLKEVLSSFKETGSPSDRAEALRELAELRRKQKKFQECQELSERALALAESSLPAQNIALADCHLTYASVLLDQEHYDKAKPHFEKALSIYLRSLDASHPSVLKARTGLADANNRARGQDALPEVRISPAEE